MEIKLHSYKQEKAVFSEAPITVLGTGIQWGKTTSGALWQAKYFAAYPYDNHIVTAPTYKIMTQATLPAFKAVHGYLGEYKKVDAYFKLHSGGNVFFRTGTEPDSIVGITNVRSIWGDEAGKYSLYFWENIQARAARLEAPIMLTTSPYTVNWIYKELIKPTQDGKRDDICLVSAKSIENPYFSKTFYFKQKKTMDPRRFKALYDGEFTQMQGLVYDCFDQRDNITNQMSFPSGTKYYGGVDWGFTHPFVITIRAILPSGLQVQISEFYKTGMLLNEMKRELKSRLLMYNVEQYFCDPSRPDLIQEMNMEKIPCVKADNDILLGIDYTYNLIKNRRLLFLEHSNKYTIDEMENYHWPEPKDLGPDQDDKERRPVDSDNHVMDTMRYISMGTRHLSTIKVPEVPGTEKKYEYPIDRINRLKKKSRESKHETW